MQLMLIPLIILVITIFLVFNFHKHLTNPHSLILKIVNYLILVIGGFFVVYGYQQAAVEPGMGALLYGVTAFLGLLLISWVFFFSLVISLLDTIKPVTAYILFICIGLFLFMLIAGPLFATNLRMLT